MSRLEGFAPSSEPGNAGTQPPPGRPDVCERVGPPGGVGSGVGPSAGSGSPGFVTCQGDVGSSNSYVRSSTQGSLDSNVMTRTSFNGERDVAGFGAGVGGGGVVLLGGPPSDVSFPQHLAGRPHAERSSQRSSSEMAPLARDGRDVGLVPCDPSWMTPISAVSDVHHHLLHESLEPYAASGTSASVSGADPLEELDFDLASLHDDVDPHHPHRHRQPHPLPQPPPQQQQPPPRPDEAFLSGSMAFLGALHSAGGLPGAGAAPQMSQGMSLSELIHNASNLLGQGDPQVGQALSSHLSSMLGAASASHLMSPQDSVASAARQDLARMAHMSSLAQGRDAGGSISPWSSASPTNPGSTAAHQDTSTAPMGTYLYPVGVGPGVPHHSPAHASHLFGGASGPGGPGVQQYKGQGHGAVGDDYLSSADSPIGTTTPRKPVSGPLLGLESLFGPEVQVRDLHLLSDEQQAALLLRHYARATPPQQQHTQPPPPPSAQKQLHSPPVSRQQQQQPQQQHLGATVTTASAAYPASGYASPPMSAQKSHHLSHYGIQSPNSPELDRSSRGAGVHSLVGPGGSGTMSKDAALLASLQVATSRDRALPPPQTPAKVDHAALSSSPTLSHASHMGHRMPPPPAQPGYMMPAAPSYGGSYGGSGHSSRTSSPPPLQRRSTQDSGLGGGSGGSAVVGGPGGGGGPGASTGVLGSLNPAAAAALLQLMVERGMDQATVLNLLQSPRMLEALEGQQRHSGLGGPGGSGGSGTVGGLVPPSGSLGHQQWMPSEVSQLRPSRSSPTPTGPLPSGPAPDTALRAPTVSAGATMPSSSHRSSGSGMLSTPPPGPAPGNVMNTQLLNEFTLARSVLVQLMLSAYAFLNSESMQEFHDKLAPVASLYDSMHDLSVMQKRKKCLEMALIRQNLLQDASFVQILQAICALRHHLYSLSRKVLLMNQGPDGVPVDLLLGSMSSELYHLMKTVLPQEVSDFFGNNLPFAKLAVLVFGEFTTVDPMPTLT